MQATTIKLEDPLLGELKKYLPKEESISSFVRNLLEKEIQRQKMIQAAEEYSHFLAAHPEEKEGLEEWESADLTTSVKRIQKRKKR